jgi:molecular chaperone GrpE
MSVDNLENCKDLNKEDQDIKNTDQNDQDINTSEEFLQKNLIKETKHNKDSQNKENISKEQATEIKSEIDLIKHKLNEQNKLADEYLDLLQRSQANFINYKNRVEKETKDLLFIEQKKIISSFLDFKETLKKAYEYELDSKNKENILQLINNYDIILKRLSVEKMELLNKEFDYNYHECVFKKETEEENHNKIIEIIEDGYLLNKRLLKPAKVVVGNYIKK